MKKTAFAVVLLVAMAFVPPASAQDESSWGVQVSSTPGWNSLPVLEGRLGASDEPWDRNNQADPNFKNVLGQVLGSWFGAGTDLSGSDITFGVVRGSINGGEWGVSYVRRNINGSSRIESLDTQCFGSSGRFCFPVGNTYELHSVSMTGVELYKFVPFVRFDRVQLGATVGAGIARMNGTVTEHSLNPALVSVTSTQTAVAHGHKVREASAAEMLSTLDVSRNSLLARVEATAAVRLTSHLKVRVGGGFNYPGTAYSVGATYLF